MASSVSSVVGASTDTPSGVLRWEVDKDSIKETSIYSPEIEVGGMLWNICLCTVGLGVEKHLGVYLCHVEGDYVMHNVKTELKCKLINNSDVTKTTEKQTFKVIFSKKCPEFGYSKFINWELAADNGEGFIKDGKLCVEIEFTLWSVIGFRKLPKIDFTDPKNPCHDIALVIEGEKVYVSKAHLSIHSPVFKSMMYGDFTEKDQTEIELKDIDRKEFVEMLNVIYSASKKITNASFGFLLKLGDRFEIELVINRVVQFLITTTKLSIAAKLLFAGQYRLFDLQEHCIDSLHKIEDVKVLMKTKDYQKYSSDVNMALLEKMAALSD